ncbi:hypothetical protein B0A50_02778 [Salinomyces thailandicus]|uniref:Tyrosinase copper-binding domain-containing protein n=1 Tax=Salinomyces thailandicus TaxID=706561 RepID=A0A4V5N7H4_9PEZI|nr:hypothetical protein B0A50_02778 [Salinomyces thailandica]
MKFCTGTGGFTAASLVAAQAIIAGAAAPSTSDYSAAQVADGTAFKNISDIASANMQYSADACTYESASVRAEWRTLDEATRKSFTDAVTCLSTMEPTHMKAEEASDYPGVKSRFDEFVATHINYTMNIHDTADFLAWHRTFIHFWEQDLKNLCGYTGNLPYWNWALDADAPQDSPLFSGDEYSVGSNGKYIDGRSDTWLATMDFSYPPGTGGGCVESGPFVNYTVNLGPLDLPNTDNVNSSFQYNPRCLVRDLNPWFTTRYNTYTNLTETILDNIYIEDFQNYMQGYGSSTNKLGVHGGAHWASGGSMQDFHSSPADPLFFLHHGMIDYTWVIWQNLDNYRRIDAINGTSTLGNDPPSAEMTLDDIVPFGFVADDQRFGDLMDTTAGLFCYRYE